MSKTSLGLAAVFALTLAVPVSAHFGLSKSSPAAGQTLEASPKRLQIWFSQVPAAGVSQIKLALAGKTDVAIGKTIIDKDTKSLYVDLDKPLAPGAYVIAWRGAGDDGHVSTGEIKFSIAPPK